MTENQVDVNCNDKDIQHIKNKDEIPKLTPRKLETISANLITFGLIHVAALYGAYLCFYAKWPTLVFDYVYMIAGGLGITAGAHRLWAHRTYKAKLPLEILLIVLNSISFQNTALHWIRDHRLHHKHSDTEADPHNANRGFFYSHIGWLLVKKNDEVKKRGKAVYMDDLNSNPVLRFQKKYAIPFIGMICFVLPTIIPVYFWGESWNVSWHLTMLRYVTSLHLTFLVNSAAHLYGNKPYNKDIVPRQNLLVSLLAIGEGFHNYHHVFPWDYRTAELGNNKLNLTTKFIDLMAWIGWAYDLKAVPEDLVKRKMESSGDGTNLWGWGDKEMSPNDERSTETICPEVGEKIFQKVFK